MKSRILFAWIVFVITVFAAQIAVGQATIQSNGTGGGSWTATTTWQGGVVPANGDSVVILGTDSVSIPAADTCKSLTILSNGRFYTGTSASTMTVTNVFSIAANGWYYNYSSNTSFPGATRVIDNMSNYVHIGSGTVGSAGNNIFGNLIFQRGSSGTTAGAPLAINGNMILNNTSTGATVRGTNATLGNLSHTIFGNVTVNGGQWSCIDVGTDTTIGIWNVKGNVLVTSSLSRIGPFSSASAKGLGIFNIDGDLSITSSARLQVGSSSTLGTGKGIINLKKNLTIDSSVALALNHNGPFAINFVGTGVSQIVTLKRSISFGSPTATAFSFSDTIAPNARVIFANNGYRWEQTASSPGSFVVKGSLTLGTLDSIAGIQNFIVDSAAYLVVAHPNGFSSAGTVGSIQVTGTRTFSTAANYEYKGTVPQVTGDGLPSAVNYLSINNPAGVKLTDTTTVTGMLILNQGNLSLGSNVLITAMVEGGMSNSYIVTDSTGALKIPKIGTTKTQFAVGTTSSYSPVWIANTGMPDNFSVRVQSSFDNALFDPTKAVNKQWTVLEDTVGNSNIALTLQWNTSDEAAGFVRTAGLHIGRYTGTAWTPIAATLSGAGPFTAAASGLTSLGNFGIGNPGTFKAAFVTITSNGTGGGTWSSTTTWQGGVVPDTVDVVTILGTDSVNAATATKCAKLTVKSGGKLAANASFAVTDSFILQSSASYYNNSTSGSLPGAMRVVDVASNVIHIGTGTVGSAGAAEFGNLIIQRTSGVTAGANLTVKGNLIMNCSGSGVTFRGTNATLGNMTHNVLGNVYINTGQWSCIDVGTDTTVAIWNVKGDVIVMGANSRIGPFTSASAKGLGIFNIDGSLSVMNGARFQVGSSSTFGTGKGILNLKGNFTLDTTAAVALNHNGPFAFNFKGADTQHVVLRRPLTLGNASATAFMFNDTVIAGSIVKFEGSSQWGQTYDSAGTFVVNGTLMLGAGDTLSGIQNLAINTGSTLIVNHPNGIAASGATGSIQVTGKRTFDQGASYGYAGTAAQVTGDGLPNKVNSLLVRNPAGLTLTKALTVQNELNFVKGKLLLGNNGLSLVKIVGASTSAYIVTDGTGSLKNTSGDTTTVYPIGIPAAFTPVTIINRGAKDTFSVKVAADTANRLNRVNVRWNIVESVTGGSNATLQFGWMAALEGTNFGAKRLAGSRIYRLDDSLEVGSGLYTRQLTTEPYTVSRGGITTFGNFVVGPVTGAILAVEEEAGVPIVFALHQNYPNPFNPTTTIRFTVQSEGKTTLKIYNAIGQEVSMLYSDVAEPGTLYTLAYDARSLASGMYFSVLESAGQRQMKKMIILK